ncbi:MAG TPA: ArsR family transcriptional regulator [Candidatus Nanopelagicales bacterium]|nr:ArsR family transcriptional regulator [Candidatus Nanopelagicales bacterium]
MSAQWGSRAAVHAVLADENRLAVLHHVALGDRTPKEISGALDIPQPLLSHHLKVLTEAGLIARTPSEHDRRQHFVTLRTGAWGFLDREWMRAQVGESKRRVVFACTQNSARSVLASALWTQRTRTLSAAGGTSPGARIHPSTRRVARRHELSLLQRRPIALSEVLRQDDLLVTVCDAADAQLTNHPHRLHWSIPDPATSPDPVAFDRVLATLNERIDRLEAALTPPREERTNDG